MWIISRCWEDAFYCFTYSYWNIDFALSPNSVWISPAFMSTEKQKGLPQLLGPLFVQSKGFSFPATSDGFLDLPHVWKGINNDVATSLGGWNKNLAGEVSAPLVTSGSADFQSWCLPCVLVIVLCTASLFVGTNVYWCIETLLKRFMGTPGRVAAVSTQWLTGIQINKHKTGGQS